MTPSPPAPLAADFQVVTVDPIQDARWQALLRLNTAGLFHSPPWMRALSDAYSFKVNAHIAVDAADVVRGGIAFCAFSDVFAQRVVSLPFSDTCDPLLESPDAWPALFAHLQKLDVPVHMRCLEDQTVQADPRFEVAKRARWHTLPVTGDAAAISERFDGSVRRALRKAKRSGVIVRPLEGSHGLTKFHALHVALRKQKYRLLAQPLRFFEAIMTCFDAVDGWYPLGAFVDGQLVAATLYLRWGDTLYYKFNASRPDALELRPNNLLVSAGIELAQSLGCHTLDLGPSDHDQPGLIRFKRQFGAHEREVRFLRYVPPEWRDDQGAELRRVLGDLTRILTAPDTTDDLTARAGALLYRFFA